MDMATVVWSALVVIIAGIAYLIERGKRVKAEQERDEWHALYDRDSIELCRIHQWYLFYHDAADLFLAHIATMHGGKKYAKKHRALLDLGVDGQLVNDGDNDLGVG